MSFNRFRIPTIYFGKNSTKQLKNFRQKRIFIVTDRIVEKLFGEKLKRILKNKEFKFYSEVEPDPMDNIIINGGKLAQEFQPELIIGIGGGSVMDTAKGVYFLYERTDKNLYDINPLNYFKLGKKSKLILIPTTSGTGAEHTGAIIVTKSDSKQKVGLISFELVPSTVILDPKLPLGMPPKLTASTGIDAFVHAIESYINRMNNEFTQIYSLNAMKTLFNYLPLAVNKRPDDINIREKIHYAASMAGIALANSAAGLAHSCGHALGSIFKIPHGIAVGLMLPYIIQFNEKSCFEKYKIILNNLDIHSNKNPALVLSKIIQKFLKYINLPISIKKLNISNEKFEEKLEKLIEFAFNDLATSLNPRQATKSDIEMIFKNAYEGKDLQN